MALNTLPDERQVQMRLTGILEGDEVAVSEGDLLVAVNVVTGARRILREPLSEASQSKRLLKG